MSTIFDLGAIGTFFSDEISALENFVNWVSSTFINFMNAITTDIQNTFSFIGQAISDIPTFMQNIATDFLTILQNFVQTAIPIIQGFLSWLEQQIVNAFQVLSSIASQFINDAYGFFQNIANVFSQIIATVVQDFLSGFGSNMSRIAPAISQIVQFLTPFIAPITIGKFLPAISEKLAEILPEIEISLAPIGLGGKIPIKFGEIIKAFAESGVDFLNEVRQEIQVTLKEFLKEPFIADFKLIIGSRDAEKGLKSLGFDNSIISETIFEYQTAPLIKYQISQIESLARKGYLSVDEIKKELNAIGVIKEFEDVFLNYLNQEIAISSTLNILKQQLRSFLVDPKFVETELRKLKVNDYLVNEIIQEEYNINIAKLQFSLLESIAKTLYFDQQQLNTELRKIVKDKTAIDIYTQKFYFEYIYPKIISYYTQLARHGITANISKLPKDIVEYEIKPAIQVFQLTTEIEYIKTLLKDLQITPTNAISKLENLGMQKDLANLFVQTYIPTFYSLHTIISNIVQGELFKVGKIPINLGNAENELRKLGIPDNQIKVLLEQYASSFGLEIWRKYLPSLSNIENAIKYNYPLNQLVEYSFIPSELLNLHVNLFQQIFVGEYVQSLKNEYIQLLVYGVQNTQLESLLKQYGINDVLLGIYKLSAQIRKLLMAYQELYITPSKALQISEYLSNPTQLLQKVFSEFQVPNDLQNVYFEYARNRRISRYVHDIITTINLLFEKQKIDLNTAQQYLQQLKKYGLTDEEIQLIILNWQLRSAY